MSNRFLNTANVPLQLTIQSGVPYYIAVMLDSTSFSAASWTAYSSSNIPASLGTVQGWHTVWVGLSGASSDPAADPQQSWNAIRLNLDLTGPVLVATNATNVTLPVLQLGGYAAEPLSSISYGLSNAAGVLTNQQALVTDQYYDMGIGEFTTNYFCCLDIALTNGLNVITLLAADMAGNITVTNFNFTLDYSGKTVPAMQIIWPPDGSLVSGASFTCRGSISDPTASLTALSVDTNGDTNIYAAAVGRDGNFWVQNLPLNAGTNLFSISLTDVLGSNVLTNINIVQSALALTMDDVSLSPQLWQPTINLSGTLSDWAYTVWVNGVQGTNDGYGNWSASGVPVDHGRYASFVVAAYAVGQTQPGGAIGLYPEKPPRVYVSSYQATSVTYYDELWATLPSTGPSSVLENDFGASTNIVNWTDGSTGSWYFAAFDEATNWNGEIDWTNVSLQTAASPVSSWPNLLAGTPTNIVNGSICDVPSSWTPPIVFEHCDLAVPYPDMAGSSTTYFTAYGNTIGTITNTGMRHAQTPVNYQTAGPPGSTAQNLYIFSCSATNNMPLVMEAPPDWVPADSPATAIPPQNIAIGTLGSPGPDGNLYLVLPDNAEVELTPTVSGVAYFIFGATNGDPVAAPKYTLMHQCVATNPPDQSRLTLGVGEEVNFFFSPPLPTNATWAGGAAGSFSPTTGPNSLFTATNTFGAGGGSIRIFSPREIFNAVRVCPPTNSFVVTNTQRALDLQGNRIIYQPGQAGAATEFQLLVFPTNVSQAYVKLGELKVIATNIFGCFTNTAIYTNTTDTDITNGLVNIGHTTAGYWFNTWNDDLYYDRVWSPRILPPYSAGSFQWVIPTRWKPGENGPQTNLFVTTQTISVDSNGTVTITKCANQNLTNFSTNVGVMRTTNGTTSYW